MFAISCVVNFLSEYLKEKKVMGTAMEIDQSNTKLLADLKRMKESLFYSEDKVSSLTERLQIRDKVRQSLFLSL